MAMASAAAWPSLQLASTRPRTKADLCGYQRAAVALDADDFLASMIRTSVGASGAVTAAAAQHRLMSPSRLLAPNAKALRIQGSIAQDVGPARFVEAASATVRMPPDALNPAATAAAGNHAEHGGGRLHAWRGPAVLPVLVFRKSAPASSASWLARRSAPASASTPDSRITLSVSGRAGLAHCAQQLGHLASSPAISAR
jgi:hypothetical protein